MISTRRTQAARSWLFVSGDRPERFDKAVAAGADMVIIDLEDAVPADTKDLARRQVGEWLAGGGSAAVRINPVGTPCHEADLAVILPLVDVLVVPKAEDADLLALIATRARVLALVETAAGIERAGALPQVEGVVRLALGHTDLAAEIGVDPDDHEAFTYARSRLVMTSAAAGLALPVDGATTILDDDELVAADVARAKRLGFTGKLCIHPRQVRAVHAALEPAPADVARARRLLAEVNDEGASVLDGRMIDRPVLLRAQRILELAAQQPEPPDRKAAPCTS